MYLGIIISFLKKISLEKFFTFIVSLTAFALFRKNKNLNIKNRELEDTAVTSKKIIKIQKKVLNASRKIDNSDLSNNLRRMHNKEL